MKNIILVCFCFVLLPLSAQKENQNLKKGNKLFKAKEYEKAEVNYLKGLDKNPQSFTGNFNIGDSYARREKFEKAASQFELAVRLSEGDTTKMAASYHNLGNALLKAGKVDDAIDAYKDGLRLDPKANDTRYNLAFALNLKKKQEEQKKQDQKDQKNKDKKDQQKDQQKKEEEKKQQEKKQQEKKEKQKQDKKEESQQDKQKMSEANAAQILQALQNDEKEVQKKIKKQQKTKTYHVKKDW